MEKERDVVVLIPTYFADQMLFNCLNSLFKFCPGVKVMTFKNDIGWLKACNELMRATTTDVILMNDDVLVESDLVFEMQQMAYSKPEIGIVGGKALNIEKTHVINYGIYVAIDGNTAHKHFGRLREAVDKPEAQQAVEGSCIYIKREVLDKVGYFDEIYGMGYREEIDLAFRAKQAGYKVVSTPKAEYIHLVSQTHGKLGITNDTHKIFMDRWGSLLKEGRV
jgi:GT2 family glycosyltransferase